MQIDRSLDHRRRPYGRPHGNTTAGFTLVELLVVIGIIAVLIGILLPVLAKARESANAIKCASNLRSVGQGMAQYLAEFKQTYPAAYIYNGMALNIDANTQTPDKAVDGYVHWSSFLYGRKDTISGSAQVNKSANGLPTYLNDQGWQALTCPSIEHGGLPPTNTYAENRDAGQQNDDGDATVDFQAVRCAFTVNEAICPRNKFVTNFQGSLRKYHFVKASQIRHSATTILATEWNQDWHVVADTARDNTGTSGGDVVCKSHRPIHAYKGIAGGLNVELIAPDPFGGRPTISRVSKDDLMLDPVYPDTKTSKTRLDWVGRNHFRRKDNRGYQLGKSNFLYVDGHVETKTVAETLAPAFEWGDRFYSLVPESDIVNQ